MIAKQVNKTTIRPHLDVAGDRIVLHTPLAESLFNGSWKPGRMGLVQFAIVISRLYTANKADDPYAEWFLLKIDKAIFMARQKIKDLEALCQGQLDSLRGIEIVLFTNTHPAKFPLNFSNPFSYMAASLLADVDYVTRLKLTLERKGLVVPNDANTDYLKHIVQTIFITAAPWRNTKITRKDIIENNQDAQNICDVLGDVPIEVMNKEVIFSFSVSPNKKSYELEAI